MGRGWGRAGVENFVPRGIFGWVGGCSTWNIWGVWGRVGLFQPFLFCWPVTQRFALGWCGRLWRFGQTGAPLALGGCSTWNILGDGRGQAMAD